MTPQSESDVQFDVFLCHNSKDKPEVIKIHEELEQQGLEPFLVCPINSKGCIVNTSLPPLPPLLPLPPL